MYVRHALCALVLDPVALFFGRTVVGEIRAREKSTRELAGRPLCQSAHGGQDFGVSGLKDLGAFFC